MYQINRPPFTLNFSEMTKKQLKDYNDWFHGNLATRIQVLSSEIKSTKGYEEWEADCSVNSLNLLGDWFFDQVETIHRTQDEILEIQNQSSYPIEVPNEELSDRTFSLAMDIGMYVSQVFKKQHPGLSWSQLFGSKKSIDYGQPILVGFGSMAFNPVHTMVMLAYGFSRKSKSGRRLREIFDYWSERINSDSK